MSMIVLEKGGHTCMTSCTQPHAPPTQETQGTQGAQETHEIGPRLEVGLGHE